MIKVKKSSKLEIALLNQINLYNADCLSNKNYTKYAIPNYVQEHQFCPWRKWKFDFAWKQFKLAVEVEGTSRDSNQSRHTTAKGYGEDCIKYNTAICLGWRVIRVTRSMIDSGLALVFILNALGIEAVARLEHSTSIPSGLVKRKIPKMKTTVKSI